MFLMTGASSSTMMGADPEGGFIHEKQFGLSHECPADGKHLLFTTA